MFRTLICTSLLVTLVGCADAEDDTSSGATADTSGTSGASETGTTGDAGTDGAGTDEAGAEAGADAGDTTDGGGADEGGGDCLPNETDPSQFVIVGFWNGDPTCSGDPIKTNAFPVGSDDPCYCWPGNSGMNSADSFMCDAGAGSFTYTQYNSLTCGAGDDTPTEKTTFIDSCTQDIPMNLYSKIVDFGACGG